MQVANLYALLVGIIAYPLHEAHENTGSSTEPPVQPQFSVWHCADDMLRTESLRILTKYGDDVDTVAAAMQDYVAQYRTGDWTVLTIYYERSVAQMVKSPDFGNGNICYAARLDTNILLIVARVHY